MKKNLVYSSVMAALLIAGSITNSNAQWSLTGNSTAAPNNVLGTTNNTDLNIKTNNVTRIFVKGSNGFIGIGTATPGFLLDIQNSGNASMNFKSATGNANILIDRGTSANSASVNYRTGGTASWQTGNLGGTSNFVINNVGIAVPSMTILKTNNNIGVNNATPTSKVDVLGGSDAADTNAVINAVVKFTGTNDVVGISGTSQPNPGYGIGVSGLGNFVGVAATGTYGVLASGLSVGVDGEAIGADTTLANTGDLTGVQGITSLGHISVGTYGEATGAAINYGVFGYSPDTTNSPDYAGAFVGDLFAYRFYQASDARIKKNIQPIAGAMEKIMQLNATSYTFNQSVYPGLKLPGGNQLGFLAQDVEKVYPELIKKAVVPSRFTTDSRGRRKIAETADLKLVNYMGLIPVMVEGIKEQQAQIAEKDAQITALTAQLASIEARLSAMESNSTAKLSSSSVESVLEQNSPNPFNQTTQIRYSVPSNYNRAQLVITNTDGRNVKTYTVSGKGQGSITVNASELSAGTYTYSLIVDSKTVDTKTLVLTK